MNDELVERLHKRIALTTAGSPLQDDLLEAADAIEELSMTADSYKRSMEAWADEAANAQPRWISVEERLPEAREDVVFRSKSGSTYIGYMILGRQYGEPDIVHAWFGCGSGRVWDVTHWMPLPEPPVEKE